MLNAKTDDFFNAYDPVTGNRNEEVSEYACPCCGSKDIEHEENDYTDGKVFLAYRCKSCGAKFEHHYDFVGVYVNDDGKGE